MRQEGLNYYETGGLNYYETGGVKLLPDSMG